MGQYFKAVIEKKDKTIEVYDTWAFNDGAKFLEHAYLDNRFVNFVMSRLLDNPVRLAWVGDYSEDNDMSGFYKYYSDEKCKHYLSENDKAMFKTIDWQWTHDKIALNHTKKEMVVFGKLDTDNPDLLHPVCVLTAQGLGYGCGDFESDNDMLEHWCGDEIEIKLSSESSNFNDYNDITDKCSFFE